MRGISLDATEKLADNWYFEGQLEEKLGNFGHALAAFEKAQRISPQRHYLESIARISKTLGDHRRAYRAEHDLQHP
ncbi:MAG: hypothetical protein IPJ88_13025 [Myxococcales bacterium]|nr:MAG: hypothetical protein IPJ88_13025 [Myxococcales bacterium]